MPSANAYVPNYNTAFTAPMSERRTDWKRVCFKQYELGLNRYDVCLAREKLIWDEIIQAGGLNTICCPQGKPPYTQKPWTAMPKEGRRFKPIATASIASVTPFTGLDVQVMAVRVPTGYNGVIADMVCEVVANGGTGFVDGSGDITWRLAADGRFLRDQGNLKVTVGSLTNPSPVPHGMLRVYSHDLLQFFVNLTPGAEVRINPQAFIVCSITGYFWPR